LIFPFEFEWRAKSARWRTGKEKGHVAMALFRGYAKYMR